MRTTTLPPISPDNCTMARVAARHHPLFVINCIQLVISVISLTFLTASVKHFMRATWHINLKVPPLIILDFSLSNFFQGRKLTFHFFLVDRAELLFLLLFNHYFRLEHALLLFCKWMISIERIIHFI